MKNKLYKLAFYFIWQIFSCIRIKNKIFIYSSKSLHTDLINELNRYELKIYKSFSITDIVQCYNLATSKVILLDNYYHPLSIVKKRNTQIVIQLWHANGAIKKFGLIRNNISDNQRKIECFQSSNYDYVLSPSKNASEIYMKAFNVSDSQILEYGYYPLIAYNNMIKNNNNKLVVFYAPTFRIGNIDSQLKFISDNLVNPNIDFIYTLHPLNGGDNLSGLTTQEALFNCDIFISDYSSLIFEAMYLKKSVYLYQYDLKTYKLETGIVNDLKDIKEYLVDEHSSYEYIDRYNDFNNVVNFNKLIVKIDECMR